VSAAGGTSRTTVVSDPRSRDGAVTESKTPEPRTLTASERRQRQEAPLRHGARSRAYLAPMVVSMKKGLLARMGLRQRDLTWAGRETLDSYCRAKSKLVAIDKWLEQEPMIRQDGSYPDVLKLYFVSLNASTRLLEQLRGLVADLRREDVDMARMLAALDVEGRGR
jgi:hypothetical protein